MFALFSIARAKARTYATLPFSPFSYLTAYTGTPRLRETFSTDPYTTFAAVPVGTRSSFPIPGSPLGRTSVSRFTLRFSPLSKGSIRCMNHSLQLSSTTNSPVEKPCAAITPMQPLSPAPIMGTQICGRTSSVPKTWANGLDAEAMVGVDGGGSGWGSSTGWRAVEEDGWGKSKIVFRLPPTAEAVTTLLSSAAHAVPRDPVKELS